MVIFALILALPSPIAIMDSLFYDGKYVELIDYADSVAASDTGIISIEALKFKAFAYVAMDSSEKAVDAFKELLRESPFFELDPVYTFPRAMKAFQQAKMEVRRPVSVTLDSLNALLNFREQCLRKREARYYSLLLPGLSDVKLGRKKRGIRIMAAFGLSLAIWGVSNYAYHRAKDAYMLARDPAEIKSKYRVMDAWYKMRLVSGISAVGIYIYAQVSLW